MEGELSPSPESKLRIVARPYIFGMRGAEKQSKF